MKTFKRVLQGLITMCLIFPMVGDVAASEIQERKFSPQDIEANTIFEEQKNATQNYANRSLEPTVDVIEEYKDNPFLWTNEEIVQFEDVLLNIIGDNDFEKIYHSTKDTVTTSVVRDNSNNSTVLFEVNNEYQDILILINDSRYLLKGDLNMMFLEAENGTKLTVSKTTYSTKSGRAALRTYPYTLSNDGGYSRDYGPFDSLNTSLLSFLDWVNVGAGVVAAVHPVLGGVEFVTAVGGIVIGQSDYMTSYIKYWQSISKTDGSYTREKQRWFADKACSDRYLIKNRTIYFDSVRPGY